jgi:hypothetical protein
LILKTYPLGKAVEVKMLEFAKNTLPTHKWLTVRGSSSIYQIEETTCQDENLSINREKGHMIKIVPELYQLTHTGNKTFRTRINDQSHNRQG